MNSIGEYIEKIKSFTLEELQTLQEQVIKEKDSRATQKFIYTHNCCGYSNYHINKYKHYSKIITILLDIELKSTTSIEVGTKINLCL